MHPTEQARRILTRQRGDAAGIDLCEALFDGFITRQEFSATLARCRSCDDPEGCARWIEAQRLGDGADAPRCGNGALLAELGRL